MGLVRSVRAKSAGFVFFTGLLIAVTSFCVAGTVKGCERETPSEEESFYRVKEAQLLQETKEYLREAGFCNCGVTLNRVVDAQGRREYLFKIHHQRIDHMTGSEKQALSEELLILCRECTEGFADDLCAFRHEFVADR